MATARQKHAALKHAAWRAEDEMHAATQGQTEDDHVAWWSRVADAEQAYADALTAAARPYYAANDMFAFNALNRLSTRVAQDAKTSRANAERIAAERRHSCGIQPPMSTSDAVEAPPEGGAG